MDESNYFRVSIKGLVFDEQDRMLLCRESNGLWEMLGGGLDHDEEPMAALRREISEETGLEIEWISDRPLLLLTGRRLNASTYYANIIYEIKLASLDFTPTDECQELKFFSADEMLKLDAYPNVTKLAEIIKEQGGLKRA